MTDFLSYLNPTVIGAIVGALTAWFLSYYSEKIKFRKKKKGAYHILKSEIKNNTYILNQYNDVFLLNSKIDHNNGKIDDLNNFYKDLIDFPVLSHNNWEKLIEYIPHIFDEKQISMIVQFNSKLDNINWQLELLNKKKLYVDNIDGNMPLCHFDYKDYIYLTNEFYSFKNNVKQSIEDGNNICNSFN